MDGFGTIVERRIDRAALVGLVAVGDILLIGTFVTMGEIQHGTPPWEYPIWALETFLTFLGGWTVTAIVGGLYTTDAWKFPLRAVSWTIPAWIGAVVIAMLIRATPVVHGTVAPSFVLVSILVGLALLVPWRTAIALVENR